MSPTRHPASQRSLNWPLWGVVTLAAVLMVGYVVVIPLVLDRGPAAPLSTGERPENSPALGEQVWLRLADGLVAAWVLSLGASIGSFLNVVVYRTPRGMTLLGTSHCPRCHSPIRPYDNVPVFGWLSLRGLCRDCRLPISARYPLVEAATAGLFLGLAALEILARGCNLPLREVPAASFSAELPFAVPWDLVATWGYHVCLLSSLLSWTLIEADGLAVPRGFTVLLVAVGILVSGLYPAVYPVVWALHPPEWLAGQKTWLPELDTAICGGVAGLVIGSPRLYGWLPFAKGGSRRRDAHGRVGNESFLVVGLYLGWQAVVSVALLAAVLRLGRLAVAGWRHGTAGLPYTSYVLVASLLHIGLWRWLDRCPWWPSSTCPWPVAATAGVVAVLLTQLLDSRTLRRV